jgi:hypothetical protein
MRISKRVIASICKSHPYFLFVTMMTAALIGKSQKRGSPPTAGTLLLGLFVLLRIFDFLDSLDNDMTKIDNLRTLLTNFMLNLNQKLADTIGISIGSF